MMLFPKSWWAAIAVIVAGAALVVSRLVTPVDVLVWGGVMAPRDTRAEVRLTGRAKAGRLEVPVINLWHEPGFMPGNTVAARVHLPPHGEVDARLVSQRQVGGLAWHEVQVGDDRGWVISRFVVQ